MNAATFIERFPTCNVLNGQFAQDLTDEENTLFYLNESGEVGEARQNRRSTITTYRILSSEDAEMVVSYYNAKRVKQETDRLILEQIGALLQGLSDEGRQTLKASL